ncbi:MAG: undecaprenyl diphosphate synthase family protein [Thaumarchaeota archaeon]|nr:undecaprenyl diphosphate synthase family protein [Nitrososphaerota archaeon]
MGSILFIPDGSRRGARKKDISYHDAYRLSAQKVDMTVKFFLNDESVDALFIYGLSYDNVVGRADEEIQDILKVQEEQYKAWLSDPFISSKRVRVIFLGDVRLYFERLPPSYILRMQELEDKTENNDWKKLFILIGYSGRQDLMNRSLFDLAAPSFQRRVGGSAPPEVDLVVRTGGQARLSDALLYQTAYADFYVINKLITEIEVSDLELAIKSLSSLVRNFGR